MVDDWPISFRNFLKNHLMSSGGAVSVESVTLKVQGRHFIDFTLHHIHIRKGKTVLERPKFSIISSTVLFVERPDVGNGSNKRAIFDGNIRLLCGVNLTSIQKQFTFVTDGEASKVRMERSSVSSRICLRDEKWMRCYVHVLQNCMKYVFSQCGDDACLRKTGRDFKSVKRIVVDSERCGSNRDLSFGYKIIQDVETRFGTSLLVTERFLKSSSKVWDITVTQNREIARKSFEALGTTTIDESGSSSTSYPCLKAIFDVFKVVYEAVVEFQSSNVPTLH